MSTTQAAAPQTTPTPELDRALAELEAARTTWPKQAPADLADLLLLIKKDVLKTAEAWVADACRAKGLPDTPGAAAQEWLGGPYAVLRNLNLLARSLKDIAQTGRPRLPGTPRRGSDGRTAVPVFPTDLADRLLFRGYRAEVRLQTTAPETDACMAEAYGAPISRADLCLVLGAGNVSSIGPMDCLYKLFNERKLCVLKMHPVNAYLGPHFARAFARLIDLGVLRIVYGDAAEGAYLCNHDRVDEIHITGSDKTHDLIVFGRDTAARKAARNPLLQKPITSELGNVSPLIVVPGPWTEADLDYHACNIVSSLINNAGFNCNATRVVITHKEWDLRPKLMAHIRRHLQATAPRNAYYPGAADRYRQFQDKHPEVTAIGTTQDQDLPWLFIQDLDPADRDNICFTTEAFCGVFGETALAADSVPAFLQAAGAFANDTLWGTLNATLLVHPATERAHGAAVEALIDNLRYGTVLVNQWAAVGYALGSTTWGAYPEHDIYDIRSGLDVVHNTYMLSHVEKSVVRTAFRQWPMPPYFITHKTADRLARRLCAFEADRAWTRLPGIIAAAVGL